MFSILIPVAPERTAQTALQSLIHAGLDAADEILLIGDSHLPGPELPTLPAPVHIHQSPSPGANAARNLGAQLARNPILCFLDDDDAYLPGALNRLRTHITAHPEQNTWCLDCTLLSGRPQPKRPSLLTPVHLQARNLAGTASSLIIRKPLFDTLHGFDPALPAMQDWDFWIRLAKQTPIPVLSPAFVLYHDTPAPRISTTPSRRLAGLQALYTKHSHTWPLHVRLFHKIRIARLRRGINAASPLDKRTFGAG